MKKTLTFILLAVSFQTFSQSLSITGVVQDTSGKMPLPYAVVMAVRFKDSSLVTFTRSDKTGFFKLNNFPIDTYQVIISHAKFGDKTFFVFGSHENNEFDFGNFSLPPKSIDMKEVIIYAFKDPVYYKEDTLIYTADSFKVKPNATVEDLLKKLPGIKVDAQGKITAGGKQVDQVLVDGDEFFGSDQTIATRNLNADNVQSVQIYDKPNENSTSEGSDEPLKVMDLKLKEDAKKGYFGKVSGAGDFNKFYEGEVLANKFKDKEKISVFGLTSNTPKSSLGWSDMYKYGLMGDMNYYNDDDEDNGNYYYYSNDDYRNTGIPKVFKTGIYYTDKFGKKTKLTANYSYNSMLVQKKSETNSQYFLPDTTYRTNNLSESVQKNEGHSLNMTIAQTVDSLTDVNWQTKIYFSPQTQESKSINIFFAESDSLSRSSNISNNDKSDIITLSNNLKLTRRFKKKERLFIANYSYSINDSHREGILKSSNYYSVSQSSADSINQDKRNANRNQAHSFSAVYTEPITKKIKLEFSYDFNFNFINQHKQTLDFVNGEYSQKNSFLSNNFETSRFTNRIGIKFIYEVKKQRLSLGTRFRNTELKNTDTEHQLILRQSVNNILPYATYSYIFNNNKRLTLQYTTSSTLPSINQLQPVPDNTDPNYVNLGNPDLLPTFKQQVRFTYYSYKPVSGSYSHASMNFTTTNNDISNSIHYDSIGRTITQPINVNGNYSAYGFLSTDIPLLSTILTLSPNLDLSYSSYSGLIDGMKNTTSNKNVGGGMELSLKADPLEFRLGGSYEYNIPFSSLNSASDLPYSSQDYTADVYVDLPKKFKFQSDADYTFNDRRAQGYNINYLIWNASVSKVFFKKENFIVSLSANDILNQNISTYRTVRDNVIIDTKANIIGRYFLLKAVFKFNSNKKKEEEDDY